MTRSSSLRLLSGLCLATLLTSCAGKGAVDTAADAAAASAASTEGPAGPATSASAGGGNSAEDPTSDEPAGNPGGPGGDPAEDGGTDVTAQGNPGAPGDVSVFEEAGVPFSVLREDAASRCADGVCTLLDPVVGAGDPADVGTVDDCIIASQDDISYDPPAQDGLFQRGATVQATVDCTVEDSGTDGTGDTSTTDGDGSDTSDTSDTSDSSDTGDQQPPADGSQG